MCKVGKLLHWKLQKGYTGPCCKRRLTAAVAQSQTSEVILRAEIYGQLNYCGIMIMVLSKQRKTP